MVNRDNVFAQEHRFAEIVEPFSAREPAARHHEQEFRCRHLDRLHDELGVQGLVRRLFDPCFVVGRVSDNDVVFSLYNLQKVFTKDVGRCMGINHLKEFFAVGDVFFV